MNLTTITTLGGALGAAGVAWLLGGRAAFGVVLGFLAAGSCSGLCLAVQRSAARTRPNMLLHAVLGGFLVKVLVMCGLTLAIHFVPAFSERADSKAFLFAFAATALAILIPGTLDTLRLLVPASRSSKDEPFGSMPSTGDAAAAISGPVLSASKGRVL